MLLILPYVLLMERPNRLLSPAAQAVYSDSGMARLGLAVELAE